MSQTPTSLSEADHLKEVQALFIRHSKDVRAFVLSIAPNHPDVDDILQDCFCKVMAKADQFELGTNFVSWSFSIARFLVLQRLSADRRRGEVFSSYLNELLADAAEVNQGRREGTNQALARAIKKLDSRMRKIVIPLPAHVFIISLPPSSGQCAYWTMFWR